MQLPPFWDCRVILKEALEALSILDIAREVKSASKRELLGGRTGRIDLSHLQQQ